MGLRLYNTLTRTKQDFVPIDPGNVRMYVCGPTVYDFAHIGNARPLIVFDVLYRLLRHLYPGEGGAPDGSRVTYVRNITDVDDKINARAARDYPDLPLNEAIREVTSRTEAQFHADVAALGCLPPTVEPRATEFISKPDAPTDMIRLIGDLIDRGHAYAAEGHVLFDVGSMPDYGKLSNRSLDDMVAGARVEVAPYKKDPMDFVLWKPSKPGEPAWDSPWGRGRPGWHLECSAMAGALLGDVFDIHGGGIDLVFPHHENEIAQSRCAHGTDVMANYWLHNGFLQVEGEKMAKSAGNFVTIRELLETVPGDVIRLQMLMTHYRQPIDWTERATAEVTHKLSDWVEACLRSRPKDRRASPDNDLVDALKDDLNFPEAISYLDRLSKTAKKNTEDSLRFANNAIFLGVFRDHQTEVVPLIKAAAGLAELDGDFDILSEVNQAEWLRREKYDLENIARVARERDLFSLLAQGERWSRAGGVTDVARINDGIEARAAARAEKNWAEADRIRDELDAMGIALKDAKDPETGELVTTWEVKR
ncbi:cysteine--tRNA ligase [Bauldia litoralis]|uniref:Cysteine--tRNA ligase n=1 Tax=Bauldia litoralis TaxID=665467 RepID=A0A1G6DEI4_9HYPH|nr:cysteine--tRNA ligase [Bauldia litoralis]SDB43542.1 cysteinyl-tRNA synthetase [Bauldia litoralis]